MRIDIITVVPEILDGPFSQSIIGRAQKKGIAEIHIHNLRDYSTDKHRRCDDYAFSGSAGMVMTIQPIEACIEHLKSERQYDEIIYTSPDGEMFNQPMANQMSQLQNIIILCGHYKGIDQRVRDHLITKEISIGDYVLTGGELAAAVIADAVVRLIPGAISDETSALSDSFQDNLLSAPVYTRPADYKGIDQRVRDHLITKEISIGDYVLTGGELAAAVIADAVVRLIPGAISDETSALSDSFQDNLLSAPVYTRPADYKGWKVPEVLLSGNERLIEDWKYEQALERTRRLRPDLLGE